MGNAAEKASSPMLVEPPPRPPPMPPSVKSQMLRNPSRPYHMNFKRFMPNFLKPTIVNVIEESDKKSTRHSGYQSPGVISSGFDDLDEMNLGKSDDEGSL